MMLCLEVVWRWSRACSAPFDYTMAGERVTLVVAWLCDEQLAVESRCCGSSAPSRCSHQQHCGAEAYPLARCRYQVGPAGLTSD
jgi:hypothetical protein